MANYYATPILPLARGKVRYVGEPVVGIVAQSRYYAEDALELITIDYEPLPLVTDPEEAVRSEAALLHEAAGTNVLVSREFKRGDIDDALASAPVRVQGRFRMRRKTAMAIEPRAYLAECETSRETSHETSHETLTLHSATQVPGIVRDALALALGIPGDRIRVLAPDVGGGFGGKGSLYPEEIFVCATARRLMRPIKWTSDRLEDLAATSQGFDEIVDAELAVDDEGHVVGLRADVIGDVGAYSIYPWTAALEPVQVVSFLPGPYRVPHYRGRVRAVATSKAPTGPYRGVGRPISTFVMERLMDDRLRHASRQAEGGARRRPLGRNRYRLLCGIDRHRLAHLGRAGHAHQYRHRNRNRAHRSRRRHHRVIRRRLARTGPGDNARAGRCRTPRRQFRRHSRRARR